MVGEGQAVQGGGGTSINLFTPIFFLVLCIWGNLYKAKSNEVVIHSVTWSFMNSAAIVVTLTFNTFLLTWRVEG